MITYKQHLKELKKHQSDLLKYLSIGGLNMNDTYNLCLEVSRLDKHIKKIKKMTDNEAKQKADLIFTMLFSINEENKTKEDKLRLIESVVIEIAVEQRKVGRNQILNYFQNEIKLLYLD